MHAGAVPPAQVEAIMKWVSPEDLPEKLDKRLDDPFLLNITHI